MHVTIPIKKNRNNDYIITLDWKGSFEELKVNRTSKGRFASKGFIDITNKWKNSIKKGKDYEVIEFEENGKRFKISKRAIIKNNDEDLNVLIEIWRKKYGFEVNVLPEVNSPTGYKMPDTIMINKKNNKNENYELKTLKNKRKRGIFDKVSSAYGQSDKIIVNTMFDDLDTEYIEENMREVFSDNELTKHARIVVITNKGIIKKVYKRKMDTPINTRRISIIERIPYK